jgi:hypothetical protein
LRGPMKSTKTWIGWRGEWTFVKEKVVVEEVKSSPEKKLESGVDEKFGEDPKEEAGDEIEKTNDTKVDEKIEKTAEDELDGRADAETIKNVD